METKAMVEKNLIYKCIHGSTAYGLNTLESDIDKKGIFIPDLEYYFGMKHIDQQEYGADEVIYALKKFITLARDCNPNIIEVLFCEEEDILFINDYGRILRNNRDLFISRKAKFTFSGYAMSQMKRIKGHRKWIMNPQIEPKEQDFYVTKTRVIDGVVAPYQSFRENEYDLALKTWNQYKTWVENRSKERSELEMKFGYDTKHAMHLMRLLRMGKEILTGEGVRVRRHDHEELMALRNGEWSYEELIERAEKMDVELNELYNRSEVQHSPDDKAIDKLLIEMTTSFFKPKGYIWDPSLTNFTVC